MRKICIINQKGGVAKTTTTINLATGLAQKGKRVLILDLDPQGNVSDCLGVKQGKGMFDFLIEEEDLGLCIHAHSPNLHILPARENLTKAEFILSGESARETYIKRKLANLRGYDYILIDCPPSLGLLNQNALLYASEAIVPTSTDALGVDALGKMLDAIETINDVFGHKLVVSAIVPTMYDSRLKTCREHLNTIQNKYYEIVTQAIRVNSKLREAPQHEKSIFTYAKSSNGAKDYAEVVQFIHQQEKSDEEKLSSLIATTA